jgi:hypothetical protein
MAAKKTTQKAHVPKTSDAAVEAKTGKNWKGWFAVLDRAGAAELEHKAIAELLVEKHHVTERWARMVTIEYERARGLRQVNETKQGFFVTVSKTIAAPVSALYEAAATPAQRKRWFPARSFEPSSQTKDRSLRGVWKESARLELAFYPKGEGKAQIAVGVTKLEKKRDVEAERAAWKKAFASLASLVEG